MKITRIKLVNFIGIEHGLGENEIEIEFPENKRLITMLNGKNGSGKSTILSQLHPFKSSFDDRRSLIIEGKEGRKEIDIRDGDKKYEIVHIYGKKAQSFIKKNGVELNENGGVKTFNEIIFNEFNLTEDFFKLGKIGSNTASFIQFTTSERKTFISKFLPDINDYLEKFEIVKEKFRSANNEIKTITSEIEKLKDKEELEAQIRNTLAVSNSIGNEILEVQGIFAVLSKEIENLQSETNIDISELETRLSSKISRREELKKDALKYVSKYNNTSITSTELEAVIEEKSKELFEIEKEIAILNTEKQNTNLIIIESENSISKKKLKQSEYLNSDTSQVLKEKLAALEKELEVIEKEIHESRVYDSSWTNPDELVKCSNKFKKFSEFILGNYSIFNEKTVIPSERNIEVFLKENSSEILSRCFSSIRNNIKEQQELLYKKENLYSLEESNLSQLEILKKRPSSCTEDSCPFIKNALQYRNLPERLEKLQSEISSLKSSIKSATEKAEVLEEIQTLSKEFFYYINEELDTRNNQVYQNFLSENSGLVNFLLNPVNICRKIFSSIIDATENIISHLNRKNEIKKEIENLNFQLQYTINTEKLIEELNEEVAELNKNLELYKESFNIKMNSLEEKVKEKEELESFLSDHKSILNGKKEYNILNSQISVLSSQISEIKEKKEELSRKEKELSEKQAKLISLKLKKEETDEAYMNLQNQFLKVEELLKNKKSVEENFEIIKLVKDSLDPNKGVPLYFIKAYLEKTRDITNELLNIAFSGKFEIDFLTSPTEFFIRVRSGDNIKSDIKEASQGEIALTTISISLALIEQSIGRFNILSLDEIDGALDFNNRENFINILEQQARKLNIEQIFVISHNDAFDICSANLILLPGNTVNEDDSDFMKNKEIIFKA